VHLGGCVDGAEDEVLQGTLEEKLLRRFQGLLEDQIAQVLDGLLLVQPPAQEMDLKGRLMHQSLKQPMLAVLVLLGNHLDEFLASPQPGIDEASFNRE
jgi:hypothetical protein